MALITIKSDRLREMAEASEIRLLEQIGIVESRLKEADRISAPGFWFILFNMIGGPGAPSVEQRNKQMDFLLEGHLREKLNRVKSLKLMAIESAEIQLSQYDFEILS